MLNKYVTKYCYLLSFRSNSLKFNYIFPLLLTFQELLSIPLFSLIKKDQPYRRDASPLLW